MPLPASTEHWYLKHVMKPMPSLNSAGKVTSIINHSASEQIVYDDTASADESSVSATDIMFRSASPVSDSNYVYLGQVTNAGVVTNNPERGFSSSPTFDAVSAASLAVTGAITGASLSVTDITATRDTLVSKLFVTGGIVIRVYYGPGPHDYTQPISLVFP